VRQADPEDDVGREEEREEEARVGERGGREALRVLADDEDAREPCPGQDADDEEVQELAVPDPQGVASSS
jgi:hypothetical protein